MAPFVWGTATHKFWLGGYDLSPWLRSVPKIVGSFEEKESTILGPAGAAKSFVPGLESVTFEHSGFFEAVATTLDGPDNAMFSRLGTADVPLSFCPGSGAEGDVVLFLKSDQLGYEFGDQVGELMPYKASGRAASGQLVRGTVLRAATLNTAATVNGTGQVLGPLTAGLTAYAVLHVGSCTGTAPAVTVVVQSAAAADTTFATPTDRIAFTSAGTNSYQFGSVAGPITDTRWRVKTTVTGTTPVIPIFVSFGIR
jgi:hypothetical protein